MLSTVSPVAGPVTWYPVSALLSPQAVSLLTTSFSPAPLSVLNTVWGMTVPDHLGLMRDSGSAADCEGTTSQSCLHCEPCWEELHVSYPTLGKVSVDLRSSIVRNIVS